MTMKMGFVNTEMEKPVEEHVSLQWGQYKRRRKSGVQRLDTTPSSHPNILQRPSDMHVKPAVTEGVSVKGDPENSSCIDHESPTSEKPSNGCMSIGNKNRSSPFRNGQTRRRTELESLHDKNLVMKELNLAVSRWPKLLISLSHKEKEDDFMLMKGSRLPQRPKKRSKQVEKFVTYVSPGAWLCEVSLDRYEVREKKCLRRKPAGLRGMESLDSDSG
ncbi:hypothetical protein GOP47_0017538 [Adiantum capillus-veneris]|uniref:Uncharacterized protein n=1 Tax=Adiantum capillus-veneris TaxID=13818 RepID=A0A9D4UFM3_ADICA|nr:hypothetical protein GOP47_0017538 [Adiantum capillus-veneris]